MEKRILDKNGATKACRPFFGLLLSGVPMCLIVWLITIGADGHLYLAILFSLFLFCFIHILMIYIFAKMGRFFIYEDVCVHKSIDVRETYELDSDGQRYTITEHLHYLSFNKQGKLQVSKPVFDSADVKDVFYIIEYKSFFKFLTPISPVFNKKHWVLDDELQLKLRQSK